MQGHTNPLFRQLHAELYGGVDTCFTPFIRMEKRTPRRQDITRLLITANDNTNTIPQIIFKSAEEFSILCDAVKSIGFHNIDLNLGCPYPMQTGKGRGAAMILNIDEMRKIADIINTDFTCSYSVKMRLGLNNPTDWHNLMPLLNEIKLEHITLHPRIAKQMYSGNMYIEQFEHFISQSINSVVFNGDIRNLNAIEKIWHKYPKVKAVMIGRGLLARPSLATEWATDNEWNREQRIERLLLFHSKLFNRFEQTLCGQTQILQKIKPFWEYLEPEIGHKNFKSINKATTLEKYRSSVANIS